MQTWQRQFASAVRRYDWIHCGPLVREMHVRNVSLKAQANRILQLAFELQRLGCDDAGLAVAERTLEMTDTTCSSLHKLSNVVVAKMGNLIFCSEPCMEDAVPRLSEQMRKLKTFMCSSSIVQICATFSEEIAMQGDVDLEEQM